MREDDTSRILTIWDQKSTKKPNDSVYVGSIFTNEDINNAIKSKVDGGDPYAIVDSRDEIGHGTKLASIIGARGYNRNIKGIAPNCDFAIVKLLTSLSYEKAFRENGIEDVPVYNEAEILKTDLSEIPKHHLTLYRYAKEGDISNNTFYIDVYKDYVIIQYLGDENGKNIYLKGI